MQPYFSKEDVLITIANPRLDIPFKFQSQSTTGSVAA